MTELDGALRTMMRERAHDIAAVPAELVALDGEEQLPGTGAGGRRGRWLVAASIAAVLAVAGTVLGIEHAGTSAHTPPATQAPSPQPTRTSASVQACWTPLPSTWKQAPARGSTYGAARATPLAAATNGDLLVARTFGARQDIALVRPGRQPRRVFTVPARDHNAVQVASLEGNWALIQLRSGPGASRVGDAYLVDTGSGSTRRLVHVAGREIVDGTALFHGHVYWDVRSSTSAKGGTTHDYDIATHATRVQQVARWQVPIAGPAGFYWTGSTQPDVPADLPATVSAATSPATRELSLTTDGTSWAWVDSRNRIGWWAPGQPVRHVGGAAFGPDDDQSNLSVAGPYVAAGSGIVDTRTGARAPVPPGTFLFPSVPGVLVGEVGDAATHQPAVLRVDTTGLPGLHC